jgi:hypothetical protein
VNARVCMISVSNLAEMCAERVDSESMSDSRDGLLSHAFIALARNRIAWPKHNLLSNSCIIRESNNKFLNSFS